MSVATTLPAPITQPSPIVTPGSTIAPRPIHEPLPIVTGLPVTCDIIRRIYCFSNVVTLFWDGFENGGSSRWSSSVP